MVCLADDFKSGDDIPVFFASELPRLNNMTPAELRRRYEQKLALGGPAMKARRFRNFVQKTALLIHVRSRKYHPQTIGREERFHGSLKLERLYRVVPRNRSELIEEVKSYRHFYNHERLHMSLGYRTPAAVYLNNDGH